MSMLNNAFIVRIFSPDGKTNISIAPSNVSISYNQFYEDVYEISILEKNQGNLFILTQTDDKGECSIFDIIINGEIKIYAFERTDIREFLFPELFTEACLTSPQSEEPSEENRS